MKNVKTYICKLTESRIFQGILGVALMLLAYYSPAEAGVMMAVGTLNAGVVRTSKGRGISDGEGNKTDAHYKRDISDIVTEQKPDDFPLDHALRKIRNARKSNNWKVEYEEVTYRGESAQVNGAATFTTETIGNVTVDSSSMLAVDDTLFVPDVTPANGSGKEARLVVTDVISATVIEVQALNGHDGSSGSGDRLTTIPDNTVMYRAGNAKSEEDAQTDQIYELPAQDYNYNQTFMQMIERTQIEAEHSAYSGEDFEDKVRRKLWDFRSKVEKSFIFGVRKSATVNGKEVFYSDGLVSRISQAISFTSSGSLPAPTLNETIDAQKTVFANKAGSNKRLVLCGSDLCAGIDKISDYTRNINGGDLHLFHGVAVKKLQGSFGEFNIVYSKTLDNAGWSKKGLILDLEHIFKHDMEKMHTKVLDLDSAGIRRTQDAVRIVETTCPTIRYAGASGVHAVWS
jgi:hypothetical protein